MTFDGEGISQHFREIWATSDRPVIALQCLLDSNMPLDQALVFFTGKLTISAEHTIVPADFPAGPTVGENFIRVAKVYTERYQEYEESLVKMANPKRNGLTGSVKLIGEPRSKARISAQQGIAQEQKKKLTQVYEGLQELAHLTGVRNPVPPIPSDAPDFLRLYAQDRQLEFEKADELARSLGYEPLGPKRRVVEDDYVEPKPVVEVVPFDYSRRCEHGFLSREGDFYPCEYEGHKHFAPHLFAHLFPGQSEPKPEDGIGGVDDWFSEQGWAKLSKNRVYYFGRRHFTMSEAQIAAILAWHEDSGEETFHYNGVEETVAGFLEDHEAPAPTVLKRPKGAR